MFWRISPLNRDEISALRFQESTAGAWQLHKTLSVDLWQGRDLLIMMQPGLVAPLTDAQLYVLFTLKLRHGRQSDSLVCVFHV